MRLHQLPQLYRNLDALIAEADGELTPEVEETLRALDEDLASKVDWVGTVIKERLAKAEAYKAEADRLTAMRKAEERGAASLKGYLEATLKALGQNKVDGRFFKASLQTAGRPSITWTRSSDDLPEEFRRVTTTPDLQAAQEAYDQGLLPEGFTVSFTTSLRLR